jgi:hypothetical protein
MLAAYFLRLSWIMRIFLMLGDGGALVFGALRPIHAPATRLGCVVTGFGTGKQPAVRGLGGEFAGSGCVTSSQPCSASISETTCRVHRKHRLFSSSSIVYSCDHWLYSKALRSKYFVLLVVCSIAYFSPLLFGTPLAITVTRGYMLMGTYFLVLGTAVVLDRLVQMKALGRSLGTVTLVCFLLTLWGTVESIFGRDELVDPSGVKIQRGAIPPDPGSKAAGFLVRKYVKNEEKVLAIHGSIEPPNLFTISTGRNTHF